MLTYNFERESILPTHLPDVVRMLSALGSVFPVAWKGGGEVGHGRSPRTWPALGPSFLCLRRRGGKVGHG